LALTNLSFAQSDTKEKISKALTDYFSLERENIHVHLDKNIFITNEQVWFKGYVFHRKKNVPFFTTVNIHAALIDPDGKIIDQQLVYGNIGSFIGNFQLNDTMKSGKYYLQFYTNWMNNFSEDESAVYEISVINQKTGPGTVLAKADPSKINIEFHPEGGTLLNGVANTIGITVTDCNHNPTGVTVADITDSAGNIIKKVQINKLGYGKFDLPADTPQGYKAVVHIEDDTHQQPLPAPQYKGVAMEVNNFSIAEKTIIKLKTNKITAESYAGKPVYVIAHQDDKAVIYEVLFSTKVLEQVLTLQNADLFDGMNTIRIVDADMNQLAERMIYKYPKSNLTAEINKTSQTTNELQYKGKINYPNMNISVSVLPDNTLTDEDNDIYSSFLLLPYLDNQKKTLGKYYFTTLSKGKMYELDLFLLNQTAKYKWHSILNNVPKGTYPFDMGLTLRGTVPAGAGKTDFGKVRLYSVTSSIDESVEVNDKKEFVYNNLVIADSSYVNFTLLRKGEKPKEFNVVPQVINNHRTFNKMYKPQPYCVAAELTASALPEDFEMPTFPQGTILLDETVITKTRLKYEKSFGNANLTGYKITDKDGNGNHTLLQYIVNRGGFVVDQSSYMGAEVHIYSKGKSSINAANSEPLIYIDNIQLLDHSQLRNIQMSEVDELYINPVALVPSIRNFYGVIKVYLKKGGSYNKPKNATPDIIVKDGFSRPKPFENVEYASTQSKGFENFGLIDWEPSIMTDENGEFKLSVPKTGQPAIKVLIEGFSADGKLISEIKTLKTY
jgi:hypothetical protein